MSSARKSRHALPLAHWPAEDQTGWTALFQRGGMFEEDGIGSDWRPATRRNLQACYGHWLGFLAHTNPDLLTLPPAGRVTARTVAAWLDDMAGLMPSTRYLRIQAMARVLKALASEQEDWAWLNQLCCRLRLRAARVPSTRKRGRVLHAADLRDAGLDHAEQAQTDRALSPVMQAVHFRDGLILAFLALRPIRVKNLALLELHRTLLPTIDGYRIMLPEEETKNHRVLETFVPEDLVPLLQLWFEEYRPRLLARSGLATHRVWIGREGLPMGDKVLSMRITTVTERVLGVPVCPHLFRDAQATTIIEDAPDQARMIKTLLGHASASTAERHYIHAQGLSASRALTDLIGARRQ